MIDWRDPDGQPQRRITALSALRWSLAGLAVAAAHGVGAWYALNWTPAVAAGEPPPAVMIELAPLAVSAEAPPQDVTPDPQMAEAQPEPTRNVPLKPADEPDETPDPVVEEIKKPLEEAPPLPSPQPQVDAPKLPEKQEAEAVLTPPPPQPKLERKPPPRSKVVERPKPIDPKKTRAPRTAAPPSSQAQPSDRAAAPFASASLTPSMSPASWRGALMAHLNRHKRFPSGATGSGVVMVAFTIDRAGRVLSSGLVRSSGDPVLDADAVALPRRASPVPAPPPNFGGGAVTLAVPIKFSR